ncbi:hypothetical protein AB0M43_08725 [Longispora sp. NPDC051575]|uniref:hypothetical protein n=1 Tax=Longispora sp. NPDC051575 TaxID=3154943 RepID=UPI003412D1EC
MHPQQPQGITINTKYTWMAFMLAMFKPKALINGHQVNLVWGDNPIPVPPGTHTIEVWVPYLWKIGQAVIQVTVHPGGSVPVFYAAPAITFMKGAIGTQPVEVPGKVAGILLMVVPLALIVLCCCGSAILSAVDGS